MKTLLAVSLIVLASSAQAAPLAFAFEGDYRPLQAAPGSARTSGFEQALASRLAASFGRQAAYADDAALRLGAVSGSEYYRTRVAALTAVEGGVASWAELREQPVCVAQGSPYAALVSQRFGAVPRTYPSNAHALIGLKLGECRAVVDDERLLRELVSLPEWVRYNRMLEPVDDYALALNIRSSDDEEQRAVDRQLSEWRGDGTLDELVHYWIDEVAFQAYVLSDTLDCH